MSDFGKGLTYCIGMFVGHQERAFELKKMYEKIDNNNRGWGWPEIWLDGAADHLFDLSVAGIRSNAPKLAEEICVWREKCLHWRLAMGEGKATEENVMWAVEQAKELLRQIDEACLGTKTGKAKWS